MNDLIALRCPACGGHIQTEKNLEKMYCVHCGTQLILGQGSDGLLMALKARELKASTALKDAKTAQMLINYFKAQLASLEAQAAHLRTTFLQYCVDHLVGESGTAFGGESRTNKLVAEYTRAVTGLTPLTRKVLLAAGWAEKQGAHGFYGWHMDRVFALNLPGLNTAEDFFKLYQFICQPQYYDATAVELARAIHQITRIYPEMVDNREKLTRVMQAMTNQ